MHVGSTATPPFFSRHSLGANSYVSSSAHAKKIVKVRFRSDIPLINSEKGATNLLILDRFSLFRSEFSLLKHLFFIFKRGGRIKVLLTPQAHTKRLRRHRDTVTTYGRSLEAVHIPATASHSRPD